MANRVCAALLLIGSLLAPEPLGAGVEGTRPERERAAVHNRMVLKKLNTVLGPAMRRNNIQLWIVLRWRISHAIRDYPTANCGCALCSSIRVT